MEDERQINRDKLNQKSLWCQSSQLLHILCDEISADDLSVIVNVCLLVIVAVIGSLS